jgi:hypothetical protein
MTRRDSRTGRYAPSPALTLARRLTQLAAWVLSDHRCIQRGDGAWRFCPHWMEDVA